MFGDESVDSTIKVITIEEYSKKSSLSELEIDNHLSFGEYVKKVKEIILLKGRR